MNLVPLHAQPIHGIKSTGDTAMLVNLDHVYCISKSIFFPVPGGEQAEGSRLHVVTPTWSGGLVILEVVESRITILRMLGRNEAGEKICQCSETK